MIETADSERDCSVRVREGIAILPAGTGQSGVKLPLLLVATGVATTLVALVLGHATPPAAGWVVALSSALVVLAVDALDKRIRAGPPARIISGRRGRGSRTVLEKAPSGIRRKVPARADGHPRPYDGRVEAAADSLSDALALCRGSAYAGFESAPFAKAEARQLEELRLGAG